MVISLDNYRKRKKEGETKLPELKWRREFKEKLRTGEITSEDIDDGFDEEKGLESFKALMKSDYYHKIIDDFYR